MFSLQIDKKIYQFLGIHEHLKNYHNYGFNNYWTLPETKFQNKMKNK